MAKSIVRNWADLGVFVSLGVNAVFLAYMPVLHDKLNLSFKVSAYIGIGITVLSVILYIVAKDEEWKRDERREKENEARNRIMVEFLDKEIEVAKKRGSKNKSRLAVLEAARDLFNVASRYKKLAETTKYLHAGLAAEPSYSRELNQEFWKVVAQYPEVRDVLPKAERVWPGTESIVETGWKNTDDVAKVAVMLTMFSLNERSEDLKTYSVDSAEGNVFGPGQA